MIAYRSATPADGPELDAMARAVWIETFGHSASAEDIAAYLNESYGPEGALIRGLSDPAMTFHLATDDTRIVGYVRLSAPWLPKGDYEPGALQLSQLYVASDFHGTGVGDALLGWTIDTARDRGGHALYLTVWEENLRARRFYEKRDFVHVGDYAFQTGKQLDRDMILRLAL